MAARPPHCAGPAPLSLHHQHNSLPLWPRCVCVPPSMRVRGVAAAEGAAEGKTPEGKKKNPSGRSLCNSISRLCAHEWAPRHLSAEPRNEPRTRKALARSRPDGGRHGQLRNTHALPLPLPHTHTCSAEFICEVKKTCADNYTTGQKFEVTDSFLNQTPLQPVS